MVVDDKSGHDIQTEDPRAVTGAVDEVLAAIRNDTKLAPQVTKLGAYTRLRGLFATNTTRRVRGDVDQRRVGSTNGTSTINRPKVDVTKSGKWTSYLPAIGTRNGQETQRFANPSFGPSKENDHYSVSL